MIRTSLGRLRSYDGASLALYLGPPAEGGPLPDNSLVLSSFGAEATAALQALPEERFRHGVHFVLAPEAVENAPDAIMALQKYAAFVYYKYFHYPATSPDLPDPHGTRPKTPANLLHHLRLAENLPLHLAHPLTDVLACGLPRGLPVLLLLPGPSLEATGDILARLKERFVLVALSRGLSFCHDHGTMPDFCIQLDTSSRQGMYFREEFDLSATTLISLSVAPVAAIAKRFAHVFFMESFGVQFFPNDYRMRESWLSSLLPSLGLAEALGACEVVLAGSDLSFTRDKVYAGSNETRKPAPASPAPLLDSSRPLIELTDRRGENCLTTYPYLATAGEAESVMAELAASQRMSFAVFEDRGILDPGVAKGISAERMLSRDPLDRAALAHGLAALDVAPRSVRLTPLKMSLLKQLDGVAKNRAIFAQIPAEKVGELGDHPFVASLRSLSRNRLPKIAEHDLLPTLCAMLGQWETDLRRGLGYTRLALALDKNQEVALLLLAGERNELAPRAAQYLAGARLRVLTIGENSAADTVGFADLAGWLADTPLVVASAEAAAALARMLPWQKTPHVVPLEEAARFAEARAKRRDKTG